MFMNLLLQSIGLIILITFMAQLVSIVIDTYIGKRKGESG
jgi:hypothetical protein